MSQITLTQRCARSLPQGFTTTLAGDAQEYGWVDGTDMNARLLYPHGIISDPDGNLYFADTGSQIIRQAVPTQ